MWENMATAGQTTYDNVVWRIRITYSLTKATNTHSAYVIHIAFCMATVVMRAAPPPFPLLRHMCIVCVVMCSRVCALVYGARNTEPINRAQLKPSRELLLIWHKRSVPCNVSVLSVYLLIYFRLCIRTLSTNLPQHRKWRQVQVSVWYIMFINRRTYMMSRDTCHGTHVTVYRQLTLWRLTTPIVVVPHR